MSAQRQRFGSRLVRVARTRPLLAGVCGILYRAQSLNLEQTFPLLCKGACPFCTLGCPANSGGLSRDACAQGPVLGDIPIATRVLVRTQQCGRSLANPWEPGKLIHTPAHPLPDRHPTRVWPPLVRNGVRASRSRIAGGHGDRARLEDSQRPYPGPPTTKHFRF